MFSTFILANPIKSHVMEAAAICREEKCDVQIIVEQ